MKDITCPACGGTDNQLRLTTRKWSSDKIYHLWHCSRCDLEFWWPLQRPSQAWYEQAESYGTHLYTVEPANWRFLKHHLPFTGLGARMLDVGCGNGTFLAHAMTLGYEAYGIDFDGHAIQLARKRGLERVFHISLEAFVQQTDLIFDVVCLFDVLEHQNEPQAFVDAVRAILKPGGYIVGTVPNRFRLWWLENEHLRPPFHFLEWSPLALRRFFQNQGFVDVDIRTFGYGYLVPRLVNPLIVTTKRIIAGGEQREDNIHIKLSKMKRLKDISLFVPVLIESAIEKLWKRPLNIFFKARVEN